MHPTSVAGYRIVEKVGRGGMGVVYRARDGLLERDVALKYLSSPDPERVDQLIREARVVSSLQHPGIVTIYGFVAEGPCIAMEYIHGSTLSSRLAAGAMPVVEARQIGLELAEALHYAHRSGVVHADLKPANIMIDSRGRAKILDFGLARWQQADALQTLSRSGDQLYKLAGTVPYMSPELLMGRPADSRSDIFSLGCVLFELFTGRRPFSRETPAATLNAILNSPPSGVDVLRARLPAELSGLVLKMLEKDPHHRPATLGDVAVLLRGLRRDRARQSTTVATVFKRPSVRRWSALLVVLSFGVLLYSFSEPGISSRQLRVFVAQPENYRKAEGAELDNVVWSNVIDGLHLLGSVQPVLFYRAPEEDQTPSRLARMAGSDEWINIRMQSEGSLESVQIQRVSTGDGSLLEQVQFHVSSGHLEQSANAVLSQMISIYGGVGSTRSRGYSSPSKEDYLRFVRIYSTLNQGGGNRSGLFKNLLALIDESPGFLAAEVMAVDLSHALFSDTGDEYYIKIASKILARLKAYHPNPMLVLQKEITLAVDLGDIRKAEELLERLQNYSPGSPRLMTAQSQLAEYRGDLEKALEFINEAADSLPLSWRARYRAAAIAIRIGDYSSARRHIAEIIDMTPENTLAWGQLGLVELLYGDVDRSIHIYEWLLQRKQHRSYLVNLGLAHMLKGEFQVAKERFLKAHDMQPGNPAVMINLADAEMALGNKLDAIILYQETLEKQKRIGYRSALDIMTEAQCLAHLGKFDLAVERTLEALIHSPRDPEIAYQAALVYALAGEYKSALVNARAALRGGMDARWFRFPAFSGTSLPQDLESEGLLRRSSLKSRAVE